jgi:hypothetical protein
MEVAETPTFLAGIRRKTNSQCLSGGEIDDL